MRSTSDRVLLSMLVALCGWVEASAQSPAPSQGQSMPQGQWTFDGSQWQFQPGGTVMPTQPGPGNPPQYPPAGTPSYPPKATPTYPGPTPTYPQSYTPAPSYTTQPGVKVQIGGVTYYSKYPASLGSVIVKSSPAWVVRYKKLASEPWYHYAYYDSKSAAFTVARTLSEQGFWASVSNKR